MLHNMVSVDCSDQASATAGSELCVADVVAVVVPLLLRYEYKIGRSPDRACHFADKVVGRVARTSRHCNFRQTK